MVAMGGETPPPEVPPVVPVGAPEAQRQARHNYLIGRLRSRQITMEEATELFAQMQAMLRVSEAARRVAAVPAAPPAPTGRREAGHRPGAAPSGSDDLFLVGLLAMGAGAGLLAAMARRLADGAPPSGPAAKGPADRRSS